jgi:hypothetical protein
VPQGAPGCPRVPQGARLQATLVCHSRPIGRTRLGRTMPRYDLPKSMQKTDFFSKETPSENIWRYLNIYIYYIYMILYYKLYWHSISCCILQFFGLVTFLFFLFASWPGALQASTLILALGFHMLPRCTWPPGHHPPESTMIIYGNTWNLVKHGWIFFWWPQGTPRMCCVCYLFFEWEHQNFIIDSANINQKKLSSGNLT